MSDGIPFFLNDAINHQRQPRRLHNKGYRR